MGKVKCQVFNPAISNDTVASASASLTPASVAPIMQMINTPARILLDILRYADVGCPLFVIAQAPDDLIEGRNVLVSNPRRWRE